MQRIRDTDRLTKSQLTIRNHVQIFCFQTRNLFRARYAGVVPSVSKMPERGYSVTGLDPDRTVKCAGRELRISPKASVELCRTIRGMKLPEAKKLLEREIGRAHV